MSLIYGGPFDCDSDTTHAWNTPHQKHREGVNADIGYTASDYSTVIDSTRLAKMLGKIDPDGSVSYEGSPRHFHLKF